MKLPELKGAGSTILGGVADGMVGLVLGDLAQGRDVPVLAVVRDAERARAVRAGLTFFAPKVRVVTIPAWDCLPYDRVSPSPDVAARRVAALSEVAAGLSGPCVVLTTANSIIQRVPPVDAMRAQSLHAKPGESVGMDDLVAWLEGKGFMRTSTVRETGEYAVRGGILDLWAPGEEAPVRLDFFGNTLETVRTFDPQTQRTVAPLKALDLVPMSEVPLNPDTIKRFRQSYVATFGAASPDDALYTAISESRRFAGAEHWMPLFYESLESLFDYLPHSPVVLEPLIEEALAERDEQVHDYYQARKRTSEAAAGAVPYKPLEPDALYMGEDELKDALGKRRSIRLTPFAQEGRDALDLGGREGRSFAAERADENANVFDAVIAHLRERQKAGKRASVACWSEGSRDRMAAVLQDRGIGATVNVSSWVQLQGLGKKEVGLSVLSLESGFETPQFAIIGEQDVLGDRIVRNKRKSKRGADVLTEATSLDVDDYVVHVEHGIGRFVGLKTIDVGNAPHDCLEIHYAGNDKLYLPVENIELLSRYGSEDAGVNLDRLGGVGWQNRKAKLKGRLRDMAAKLIEIAAARALRDAPILTPPEGVWDEFNARFPYDETEDQQNAIDAVLEDMAKGQPMDRLICGDVGFGKTEVALRAAFVAALSGKQVAVVVPTTLLARQHYKNFVERFRGFPVRIEQASRLVPTKQLNETKKDLESGQVDIVVGTHALLGKAVKFRDLGLVVVDEEQHFGVKHKERLKEFRAEVHMLTLTATPIPRTLQLALTGVRELSIIATPPMDRLAVRTFISPFDPLSVRENLLRERYRGGQAYYVCPRISDLADVKAFLDAEVPEVKAVIAHGQMAPTELEDIIGAFYEGKFDVLLSTSIVESGLDVPSANTMVVHRSDMFGLAALYQLRGRVGRSKTRAYSLFTVPANRRLTAQAEKRLKVLQSLETLGAGFQLASHDLDIRGSGNLLGEEQSGHIKEVGFELYQSMLEETVASLKDGGAEEIGGEWSPQITVGVPVLIPETYITDLGLRMNLYKRLSNLENQTEIDGFGAELADRFGNPPEEVDHLLQVVAIKALCRRANVERIDAGPKGAVITLRKNEFAEPAALMNWIVGQGTQAKIRPDHKIVCKRDWPQPEDRLKGASVLLRQLASLAVGDKKAA